MSIIATFTKYGVSALVGFLLGLVAIAVIEPVTLNGKILLLLTVMCIVVVVSRVLMLILGAVRSKQAPNDENPPSGA